MSYQAVTWVLRFSRSVGAARMVLISIASHADDAGSNSWPSQKTIAKESSLSEFWVGKSIKKLVALGELRATAPSKNTRGKSYLYSLPLVSSQIILPLSTSTIPQHSCTPTALPPTALQKPPNAVGVNRSEPSYPRSKPAQVQRGHLTSRIEEQEQRRRIFARDRRLAREEEFAKEVYVGTGPVCSRSPYEIQQEREAKSG